MKGEVSESLRSAIALSRAANTLSHKWRTEQYRQFSMLGRASGGLAPTAFQGTLTAVEKPPARVL